MWKRADCFPRSTDKICNQKNGIRWCPRGYPAEFGPVLLFRHAISATADNGPKQQRNGSCVRARRVACAPLLEGIMLTSLTQCSRLRAPLRTAGGKLTSDVFSD